LKVGIVNYLFSYPCVIKDVNYVDLYISCSVHRSKYALFASQIVVTFGML